MRKEEVVESEGEVNSSGKAISYGILADRFHLVDVDWRKKKEGGRRKEKEGGKKRR